MWGHVIGPLQEFKNRVSRRDDPAAMERWVVMLRNAMLEFQEQASTSGATATVATPKTGAMAMSLPAVTALPVATKESMARDTLTAVNSTARRQSTPYRRTAVSTGRQHPMPCDKCRQASTKCEMADKGTSCVRCFNKHLYCNHAIARKPGTTARQAVVRKSTGPARIMDPERRELIDRMLKGKLF